MKVAIIGGTGFVGCYLVNSLVEKGDSVSLLVRPGSENKVIATNQIRTVSGDIDSPDSLNSVLVDCDAVIYCVGILREATGTGITYESTQYEGVIKTLEAARHNDVQRFILMSANGVKIPGTPYQETKKRAEEALAESELDVTIFRPSVIFGDPLGRSEFATQLYHQMVRTPFPAVAFYSGLLQPAEAVFMSPVHVEDVAAAFVHALHENSTIGHIFTLAGPEILSWAEMLRRIADATGRNKVILPFPLAVMRFMAVLLDWLPAFPVTNDQLKMLREGNIASAEQVTLLIGRKPIAFTKHTLSYLG